MPVPETRVTADAIHRGAKARRRQTSLRIGIGAVAAFAAAVTVVITAGTPKPTAPTQAASEVTGQTVVEKPAVPPALTLAPGIQVTRVDGGERALEIRSKHRIELGEGRYRIEVADKTNRPLTVTVGEQTLELVHGVVHTQVSGQVFEATLETGEARWVFKGERTQLSTGSGLHPSAMQLVRQAEEAMGRGDRPTAIDTLERLQRAYPSHQATTTGMLDLARLYRASSQPAKARCTYKRLLDRPSAAAFHREVKIALDGLGPGAGCDATTAAP